MSVPLIPSKRDRESRFWRAVESYMCELIEKAIMDFRGDATEAARYLGIKPNTMYKRAQMLGLDWKSIARRARAQKGPPGVMSENHWLFASKRTKDDPDE